MTTPTAPVAAAAMPVTDNAGPLAVVVSDVSKRFGVVQALDDVSLELTRGEIHALVGENGSGKSTLVKIIAGTLAADSGSVQIVGTELLRPTPRRSRRLGTHTVFQDGSLIPELSIAQNMFLGSEPRDRPGYTQIEPWTGRVLAERGVDVVHPADPRRGWSAPVTNN